MKTRPHQTDTHGRLILGHVHFMMISAAFLTLLSVPATLQHRTEQNNLRSNLLLWPIYLFSINKIGLWTRNLCFNPSSFAIFSLTHWGWVTHICISNLTIIDSDNGLLPVLCQAIIWTNAGILLIGPLETNFSEILIEILTFSFKKMRLKVPSFSPGKDGSINWEPEQNNQHWVYSILPCNLLWQIHFIRI